LNEELYIKAKTMRLAIKERSLSPRVFDVHLRVADEVPGGDNWCLVSREKSRPEADEERFAAEDAEAEAESAEARAAERQGESNGDGTPSKDKEAKGKRVARAIDPRVYEWHREAVVASWIAGLPDPANDEGFTIDSRERPEMPPVLQQALSSAVERERADLGARIELLSSEKQQAVQAFDTYRDRAKTSLVKSAAEQKAAESKLAQVTQELQAERAGRAKAEGVAAEKAALDSALAAATAELAAAAVAGRPRRQRPAPAAL
jgi:hypothetical protein